MDDMSATDGGPVDRPRPAELSLGYAFEAAAIPMVLLALDGRFRQTNSAFQELTGRTADQLRAMTVAEITHPDDTETTTLTIADLAAGHREVVRYEKRYLRPDGATRWVAISANLIRLPGGQIAGAFAQVLDITEAKARESALAETTERLRVLADGADDFMMYRILIDPQPRIDYLSSGIRTMLGYSAEELMASPDLLFTSVHPDDLATATAVVGQTASGVVTLRMLHKDGSTVWVHSRTSTVFDADGEPIGIDGITHDVTRRVSAEQALRSSEQRFRSMVQNATDLIFLLGPDLTVDYVSPSIEQVLGYPNYQLGPGMSGLAHPDDALRVAGQLTTLAPDAQVRTEFRIRHADGDWRWVEGVLTNRIGDPAVGGYVVNLRDVTEHHRLRDELARRANFDPLTDLPTKTHFRDLVSALLTAGSGPGALTVASMDVDGLGVIAEAFGYDHADSLIVQVTRRLRSALPSGTLLARSGTHEFAIAAPATGEADAHELARTVVAAFDTPFLVGDDPFQLDATVGATVADDRVRDAALLLRRAELARRGARTADRGYRIYSGDLDEHTADRLSLLGQLRSAIGSDQLRLHYQPKLHLASGTVQGVEALIRWQHPTLGQVAPNRFIPLAEHSGLIAPLTRWVIDEAARQSRAWRDTGIDLPIAVNITPRSLQDPAFPDELVETLRPWRLPAHALCLELTERAVTTDPAAAARACRRLTDAGLSLSLDDFGTGQSSLANLATLPISELKIDISFVRPLTTSPRAEGITRMIIDLAHDLNQTATAEGVEDQATSDLLAELGCDTAQGYHLSRPLPAAGLVAWLTGRRLATHHRAA
jgi:PAS domain S-box-containing protein/diguanylate cyclase (GGDEF)-like protein